MFARACAYARACVCLLNFNYTDDYTKKCEVDRQRMVTLTESFHSSPVSLLIEDTVPPCEYMRFRSKLDRNHTCRENCFITFLIYITLAENKGKLYKKS